MKEFIQLKVITSTPIKRHDNKNASSVLDDVIQPLQQLNTEMITNLNIEKNMLGKKGLHLNRNGLKQFAKNLIDAIREIMKIRETILSQSDTNKFIENQISDNSRIASIEDNNILHNFNDVNSNLKKQSYYRLS